MWCSLLKVSLAVICVIHAALANIELEITPTNEDPQARSFTDAQQSDNMIAFIKKLAGSNSILCILLDGYPTIQIGTDRLASLTAAQGESGKTVVYLTAFVKSPGAADKYVPFFGESGLLYGELLEKLYAESIKEWGDKCEFTIFTHKRLGLSTVSTADTDLALFYVPLKEHPEALKPNAEEWYKIKTLAELEGLAVEQQEPNTPETPADGNVTKSP